MDRKMIREIEAGGIIGVLSLILVFVIISHYLIPKTPFAVTLQVPFTSQAPLGNWTRNEDCEEASITMATAFLKGQTEDKMSPTDAQTAINQLKSWENINQGYNANTGADATMKMAQGAFGLHVTEITDYTENDLKQALAAGHPILLPINAKLLKNPKYLNGGPLYHMILVRGYSVTQFIVNDPGTTTGDGNTYTFEVLKNAAADWNNQTMSMDPSRKIALILSK